MAISLSGWIERWVAQPEKASSPEPLMSSHNLHELTLRIAACEHVSDDLSAVLGWVQAHLTPVQYCCQRNRLMSCLKRIPGATDLNNAPRCYPRPGAGLSGGLSIVCRVRRDGTMAATSLLAPAYVCKAVATPGGKLRSLVITTWPVGAEPLAQTIEPLRNRCRTDCGFVWRTSGNAKQL